MISMLNRRRSGTTVRRPVWILAGTVAAGAVGYRLLRRKVAGSADAMFAQGQVPGDVVESEGAQAAPTEERVTANERGDGVRRTGDDRLVHPVAAGEADPDAAADPTIAPNTAPGRPTGVDSPTRNT
jgi:hypothetical protein